MDAADKGLGELFYRLMLQLHIRGSFGTIRTHDELKWLILEILSREGTLTITALCKRLPDHCDSTIVQMLSRMYREHLIKKEASPSNQMIRLISVAQAGSDWLEDFRRRMCERMAPDLELLLSDEEKKTVRKTLTALDSTPLFPLDG